MARFLEVGAFLPMDSMATPTERLTFLVGEVTLAMSTLRYAPVSPGRVDDQDHFLALGSPGPLDHRHRGRGLMVSHHEYVARLQPAHRVLYLSIASLFSHRRDLALLPRERPLEGPVRSGVRLVAPGRLALALELGFQGRESGLEVDYAAVRDELGE
jgi:hypothetical protein